MKKKTLVMACSAILGLIEGAPALAAPEFKCDNYDGLTCSGDGGVIAEMEDKTFDHLNLHVNSTLYGKNLHGFSANVGSGSALYLVDSTLANKVDIWGNSSGDSFLDMTRGAIRVDGHSPTKSGGGIDIARSEVILRDVEIIAEGNHPGGARLSMIQSDFTMIGGSVSMPFWSDRGNVMLENVDIYLDENLDHRLGILVYNQQGDMTIRGGTVKNMHSVSSAIINESGNMLIDGVQIVAKATGIQSITSNSFFDRTAPFLEARNFDIETNNGSGIFFSSWDSNRGLGQGLLDNGRIHTRGDRDYGIRNDIVELTANDVSIVTSGERAHGVYIVPGNKLSNGLDPETKASVILNNVNITTEGAADGIFVEVTSSAAYASELEMNGGSVTVKASGGRGINLIQNEDSRALLDGVNITTLADDTDGMRIGGMSGQVSFKNGEINAQDRGVTVGKNSASVNISNSLIATTAVGTDSYALGLVGDSWLMEDRTPVITVDSSTISAAQSIAVFNENLHPNKEQRKNRLDIVNSTLSGDILVQTDPKERPLFLSRPYWVQLEMNADNSLLSGHVVDTTVLIMALDNNSTWTLRPSADGIVRSDVSVLAVTDSAIRFDPHTSGLYQTLAVGRNAAEQLHTSAVYNAANAEVSLNTWLNEGGALSNQQTDRLRRDFHCAGLWPCAGRFLCAQGWLCRHERAALPL